MARAITAIFYGLIFAVACSTARAADDPALTCDNLAGSPFDLDLPGEATGIAFDDLDPTDEIEQACIAASTAEPTKRRFYAHLGRLYAKRGQYFDAIDAYRLANGRGSAIAANNLGAMYRHGQAVLPNEARATHFFRKAAHRGLPTAMQVMAERTRLGLGTPESMPMAFFWYERAYEAGSFDAINDLGAMYQNGYGVREDDERAVELFAESLRRNPVQATAAYNLAAAYETGEGVPVDYGWARGFYALAFDAGNADAADDLGRLHAEGLGSAADPVAAAEWYARGAEAGSLSATVSLADAYHDGIGVIADPEQARSFYVAALDLDPDDEWRAYIDERVTALPKSKATE